jgi:hypothetical protein
MHTLVLQAFFALRWCAGVIGGRPQHALYFTGSCNGQLLYLDPHTVHDAVDMDQPEYDTCTYHTDQLLHMHVDDVDPSLALALLVRDTNDLAECVDQLKTVYARAHPSSMCADGAVALATTIVRAARRPARLYAPVCSISCTRRAKH